MKNYKPLLEKILKKALLMFFFIFTAFALYFSKLVQGEVSLNFIDYAIWFNVASLICISLYLKKIKYPLIVFIFLIFSVPALYFNFYRSSLPNEFVTLNSDDKIYKFYSDEQSKIFLLVAKSLEEQFECYGPYYLNKSECDWLGDKMFSQETKQ